MSIYLIMGCPRSGTSITAAVCQKLGLNVGRGFQDPNEFNPIGYFADTGFMGFVGGFMHYDPTTNIPEAIPLDEVDPEFKRYLREHIELWEVVYSPNQDWGFKNNYTSYIIDWFMDHCKAPVHAIITHREQEASVASFARFLNKDTDWIRPQIVSHNESLVSAAAAVKARGGRVLDVEYTRLVADPDVVTKELACFMNKTYLQEASDLVQKKYKNF